MREFSEFEKKLLQDIVDRHAGKKLNKLSLYDIFCDNTESIAIEWDEQKIILKYDEKVCVDDEIFKFLSLVYFIEYLESNGYLFLDLLGEQKPEHCIYNHNKYERSEITGEYEIKGETGGSFGVFDFKGTKLYTVELGRQIEIIADFGILHIGILPKLDRYCQCIVFPHTELVDLVNNDFKTTEQMRFEKQLNNAQTKHDEAMRAANKQISEAKKQTTNSRTALYVSWGALGVSIIATIWTICSSYTTIRDIDQIIRNNKLTLPSVIETKITNDTIKVDVVKPTPIKKK